MTKSFNVKFDIEENLPINFAEEKNIQPNFGEVTEILADATIAGPTTLGMIKVGENLSIAKDGLLSVDTTNNAEEDNTKPMTSAGVYTQLGNINVLLEKI